MFSYIWAVGGAAVWTPRAGQDHPGPCDCEACWVLCGRNECKVSGREGLVTGFLFCPDVPGRVSDTGGLEVGLGSQGHWLWTTPLLRSLGFGVFLCGILKV